MKCVTGPTLSLLLVCLVGCSTTQSYSSTSSTSNTEYIRNTQGQTQYRITDGNVYRPDGTRVARIASDGNVFNTQGTRVGRIGK